jgi:hypothetical protein
MNLLLPVQLKFLKSPPDFLTVFEGETEFPLFPGGKRALLWA